MSRVIPPGFEETDLSTFKVFVDGSDIGGTYGVLSIMVSKQVNRISSAQLILQDGDVAEGTFAISSEPLFLPGNEVEIKLGYNNTEDTVFKGIIIKHGIKTRADQSSLLIIELKDPAVAMTIGRKNKYFEDVTDSDVIEEIVKEYGLEKDVAATDTTHSKMVQYFVTDWDFILSRAEANGHLVFLDDGKLITKKPEITSSPVELAYGQNIMAFEADMDARDQFAASISRSWAFSDQAVLEEEGSDPGLDEQGNVSADELSSVIGLDQFIQQHSGKVSDKELKAWSDAKLIRSRLAKIKGSVKTQGFKDLKPGDTVEFSGFGDRFNGKAYVSSVLHTFTSETSWYTTISFGLDQKWFHKSYDDIIATPASGLVPAIQGLQTGIVTNIHEDPDGEFRVKVKIPVIDNDDEGVWARITTLFAGSDTGFFFRPEVEDEVIVGFLNDDPRDPVILGSVHSSAIPSPQEPSEGNAIKGITTKSGIKLTFDDDKVSFTVETPNGYIVNLDEDAQEIGIADEHGNLVLMNADGITVESSADLNLRASGDVNIEGTNMTNKASSKFSADGGSGAELTSGGQAVIKGAMVAIN